MPKLNIPELRKINPTIDMLTNVKIIAMLSVCMFTRNIQLTVAFKLFSAEPLYNYDSNHSILDLLFS